MREKILALATAQEKRVKTAGISIDNFREALLPFSLGWTNDSHFDVASSDMMAASDAALLQKDQSLVAQMAASGSLTQEEAKSHPQRNVILQALGIQSQVDVAISIAELKRGDQIVLCSDGLSGKVDAEEMREFLERFEPKAACQGLVTMARERGGEDNITVIVARFNGEGLSEPKPDDVADSDMKTAPSRRRSFWPWRR